MAVVAATTSMATHRLLLFLVPMARWSRTPSSSNGDDRLSHDFVGHFLSTERLHEALSLKKEKGENFLIVGEGMVPSRLIMLSVTTIM